jgi:hypothetical protein
LTGDQKIGGTISIFYPLIDLLVITRKEKIEGEKRNWEEFVKDSEKLGNNLVELTEITESIRSFSLEMPNKFLERLNDKIYNLLKEYDINKDEKVDFFELKIDKFAQDLKLK